MEKTATPLNEVCIRAVERFVVTQVAPQNAGAEHMFALSTKTFPAISQETEKLRSHKGFLHVLNSRRIFFRLQKIARTAKSARKKASRCGHLPCEIIFSQDGVRGVFSGGKRSHSLESGSW
jgi:hypothetical protein